MKACTDCGWFDYWFDTCIKQNRKPVQETDTCGMWESFEEPEETEEEAEA